MDVSPVRVVCLYSVGSSVCYCQATPIEAPPRDLAAGAAVRLPGRAISTRAFQSSLSLSLWLWPLPSAPLPRPGTPALTSSDQSTDRPSYESRHPLFQQPVSNAMGNALRGMLQAKPAQRDSLPHDSQPRSSSSRRSPHVPRHLPGVPTPTNPAPSKPVTTLTRLLSRALTRSPRPNRSCRARCAPPWPRS